MNPTPIDAYRQALQRGFVEDLAQLNAIEQLQVCYEALSAGRSGIPGLYLWGPVGRGKTWMMNRFQESLPVPVRRQHFHHFMRWVHKRLFELTGQKEPLSQVADELAAELRVLCLDELFINDIGDAMILGRLFQVLFDRGIVLVLTSNSPPDELYAGGHHRDRLLPAIEAIKANMKVIDISGPVDHRLHPGEHQQRYWVRPESAEGRMAEVFDGINGSEPFSDEPLRVGSRSLTLKRRSKMLLWCTYDQLCEAPLWANDYIELCDRFDAILVSDVPCMNDDEAPVPDIARGTEDAPRQVETGDRKMPQRSRRDNGVRRFIALVDECYDRGVPLYIEAAVELDALYPQDGYLAFSFQRTYSRLKEMQLRRFG